MGRSSGEFEERKGQGEREKRSRKDILYSYTRINTLNKRKKKQEEHKLKANLTISARQKNNQNHFHNRFAQSKLSSKMSEKRRDTEKKNIKIFLVLPQTFVHCFALCSKLPQTKQGLLRLVDVQFTVVCPSSPQL